MNNYVKKTKPDDIGWFFTDTGERINQGKTYAEYLKAAGLKKPTNIPWGGVTQKKKLTKIAKCNVPFNRSLR